MARPDFPSATVSEGQGQLCASPSSQPLVVPGATDINTDCGCNRVMNPDMGPGNSPGPNITMALGGSYATHLSPLLTAFTSSDLPLSTGRELLCLSLPQHSIHLLIIIVPNYPTAGTTRHQAGPCFLRNASGRLAQACVWVFLSHSVVLGGTGQGYAFSSAPRAGCPSMPT